MELDGYVDRLRADLDAAAAAGGEPLVDAARRLASGLDAAVRMTLLEALSDAAAEITAELAGATVEVRLRGRQPDIVVTRGAPPIPPAYPPPPGAWGPGGDDPARLVAAAGADDTGDESEDGGDDGAAVRITLRLPEALKQRAEDAANRARQSLNSWLVDAVREATRSTERRSRSSRGAGQQLSGWVR